MHKFINIRMWVQPIENKDKEYVLSTVSHSHIWHDTEQDHHKPTRNVLHNKQPITCIQMQMIKQSQHTIVASIGTFFVIQPQFTVRADNTWCYRSPAVFIVLCWMTVLGRWTLMMRGHVGNTDWDQWWRRRQVNIMHANSVKTKFHSNVSLMSLLMWPELY